MSIIRDYLFLYIIKSFGHPDNQPKQVTTLNLRSMRIILVLDFATQFYDLTYGSMTTESVLDFQPKAKPYDIAEAGNSHLQFQLEMDSPHILILTDLKNSHTSSVIKLSCDIRINYIASVLEQNLGNGFIAQPPIFTKSVQ